jgi:hypothetical protein
MADVKEIMSTPSATIGEARGIEQTLWRVDPER